MKTLVVSGGGSWGAYTVGKLYKEKKQYDTFIGTSTGSLIVAMIAAGKYEELKSGYTSITSKDIFDSNPFDEKGNIKPFHSLQRLIRGKRTIGETNNLRKLISRFWTREDYNKIINSDLDLFVTVCNISKEIDQVEYASIRDYKYEEFCDFIWASCNVPGVTSIMKDEFGFEYVDGGLLESIPLIKAAELRASEVDVFIHDSVSDYSFKKPIKNIFNLAGRVYLTVRSQLKQDDLKRAQLINSEMKVSLNYLPFEFDIHPLVFNKEKMEYWFQLGYNS